MTVAHPDAYKDPRPNVSPLGLCRRSGPYATVSTPVPATGGRRFVTALGTPQRGPMGGQLASRRKWLGVDMERVIGLYGPAGAGKSTVADILIRDYGYRRVALADPVRKHALALDPLVTRSQRLSTIVDAIGWDAAKRSYPEVRRTLQRMGTEVGRGLNGEDFWIDHFRSTILNMTASDRIVVDDVRFNNEALQCGFMFEVRNPATAPLAGPEGQHASEAGVDVNPSAVIYNDSSISWLEKQVAVIMSDIERRAQ